MKQKGRKYSTGTTSDGICLASSAKRGLFILDTSPITGQYPWARETDDDIMKDYFSRFAIDDPNFDFIKYWPDEKGMMPDFLRRRSMRVAEKESEKLTLMVLTKSARAVPPDKEKKPVETGGRVNFLI